MGDAGDVEGRRLKYAFWLAMIGLSLAVIVTAVLVFATAWQSDEVVAVVGLFTSVLGTLVGAFFGAQIGAQGREQERQDRREAEGKLARALGQMNPDRAKEITQ